MYFDNDKIQTAMGEHDDHLTATDVKNIPKLLNHPIVITEYKPNQGTNTMSIYGNLTTEGGTPIVVGVVITKGINKNVITKIRTVHARSDFEQQITDDSVLFLGEDKKEMNGKYQVGSGRVVTVSHDTPFIEDIIPQEPDSVKSQLKKTSDKDYLDAVNRGDMETAQRMVDEAAKEAGYDKLFYHGAKKGGGFTVFRDWSYFTENKQYAERYADRNKNDSLYTSYVKLENLFDTRKTAERRLFDEIRGEYGLSDIQESGLPDWTDGYDISDYIDENDLNYDGIVLDEGGDLVNGKPVSRGLSYVVRKSAQIKSADPVTYDDKGNVIPLSERFNSENNDIRYQKKRTTSYAPTFYSQMGNVIEGGFVDKGGYMDGWYRAGVDVNQEVLAVKKDIEDGKSSLDVDYGMNKLLKEKQIDKHGIKKQAKKTSRIALGMTDSERANVLREETIDPKEIEVVEDAAFDWDALEKNRKSAVEKPLIEKLRDLGYLRAYKTDSIDVEFEFTGGGLRKSLSSQVEHYGGSLADLTKVVMNMQTLLDNSVLLEIHTDKAIGTPKENARLMQTYVLLSAYKENGYITPVQFEVKQYIDNENRLYLAVALTKIEASVLDDTALPEEERTRLILTSGYSIPQLIEKINPKDENFFKYIPDEFLNEAQKLAKRIALEKEAKKYGRVVETDDIKSQKKTTTNRTLLANALESAAQNDIEKNKLAQYKSKIELIESEQAKLAEVRAKANELRFTKGRTPDETKQMKALDFEARQIENRINTYDRQLLNL